MGNETIYIVSDYLKRFVFCYIVSSISYNSLPGHAGDFLLLVCREILWCVVFRYLSLEIQASQGNRPHCPGSNSHYHTSFVTFSYFLSLMTRGNNSHWWYSLSAHFLFIFFLGRCCQRFVNFIVLSKQQIWHCESSEWYLCFLVYEYLLL